MYEIIIHGNCFHAVRCFGAQQRETESSGAWNWKSGCQPNEQKIHLLISMKFQQLVIMSRNKKLFL